ncbi:MAG: hypothetical protein PHW82_14985 [Bacteroidales bacterium]|nr:hypothetical protein [Bacteroidales bacterium]
MKATLIIINFALSFLGLCIDWNNGTVIIPLLGLAWFCTSCYLLYRADKTGTMDRVKEIMKIDDL